MKGYNKQQCITFDIKQFYIYFIFSHIYIHLLHCISQIFRVLTNVKDHVGMCFVTSKAAEISIK